jgi:ferredoxin
VDVTFVNPDDTRTTVSARVGETLLQAAHRTGIEMEGACEGVCACSTCHVILEQELYDRVLEDTDDGAMGEDEEDMLDMAFGLSHTSRLGCQITLTEYMDGGVFTLPKATRNFYVDGHKPKPHWWRHIVLLSPGACGGVPTTTTTAAAAAAASFLI